MVLVVVVVQLEDLNQSDKPSHLLLCCNEGSALCYHNMIGLARSLK